MILKLKIRQLKGAVGQLDRNKILDIVSNTADAKDATDRICVLLGQAPIIHLHDIRWLKEIVNWVPINEQGQMIGATFVEQARWIGLALKLDDIDEREECDIEVSEKEQTMIWDRIRQPNYRILGMPAPFASFISDFCSTCGYDLDGITIVDAK